VVNPQPPFARRIRLEEGLVVIVLIANTQFHRTDSSCLAVVGILFVWHRRVEALNFSSIFLKWQSVHFLLSSLCRFIASNALELRLKGYRVGVHSKTTRGIQSTAVFRHRVTSALCALSRREASEVMSVFAHKSRSSPGCASFGRMASAPLRAWS
jgi:hypothetical protein